MFDGLPASEELKRDHGVIGDIPSAGCLARGAVPGLSSPLTTTLACRNAWRTGCFRPVRKS